MFVGIGWLHLHIGSKKVNECLLLAEAAAVGSGAGAARVDWAAKYLR